MPTVDQRLKRTAKQHMTGVPKHLRLWVVVLLLAAYAVVGLYFRLSLKTGVVYSHFAYVPIVLSGMWWGRRNLAVAGVLAVFVLLCDFLGGPGVNLAFDALRVSFFILAAFVVGTLSEKNEKYRRALEQSNEQYRTLLEKSVAGICIYRDEKILYASTRLERMLGYEPGELEGMEIWPLFEAGEHSRIRSLLERRSSGEEPELHYEARLKKRDGNMIWADIASSPISFDGGPAVIVNIYDITERKRIEEKRQELSVLAREQEEQIIHSTRLAELGEMAAAIAHEINQPLTGIRNFARNAGFMLNEGKAEQDKIGENLDLIVTQVDRASRIINQMRQLTRKTESDFTRLDLNDKLKETIDFLEPQMRLSSVEVTFSPAADLPSVTGDSMRLQQVFLNVLVNAMQAMEESTERRLEVTTRWEKEASVPVVVEVSDTGKGFDTCRTEDLFKPFYTTKKPGQGTGLGLSVSYRIIKDHGGTIKAEGVPGRGAKFIVRLPVVGTGAVTEKD